MVTTYAEPPPRLRRFQERYPALVYPRKTRLHAAGDKANHIYLLVDGTTKISKISYTKQPLITLLHSGELWAQSLFTGESNDVWTSGADTATPISLHRFPAEDFRRAAANDAKLMHWVAVKLRERTLRVERQLELMHTARVEHRLMLTLADIAEETAGGQPEVGKPVEIPLTQGELASLVGATRETTSTILNLFVRRGFVQLRRGAVFVLSCEVLRTAVC